MKKYYTSINLVDNKFVGTVFDSSNNQEVYKTQQYSSQIQAVQDITNFLTGQQTQIPPTAPRQVITNSTSHVPVQSAPRRCCGR